METELGDCEGAAEAEANRLAAESLKAETEAAAQAIKDAAELEAKEKAEVAAKAAKQLELETAKHKEERLKVLKAELPHLTTSLPLRPSHLPPTCPPQLPTPPSCLQYW